jgi:hypothetical protein
MARRHPLPALDDHRAALNSMSRPLIYSMGVSLDGNIAGPRGEGDWAAPDAELHRFHNEQASELDLHILGRRLYEVMTYWETAEERNPAAPEHELVSVQPGEAQVSAGTGSPRAWAARAWLR